MLIIINNLCLLIYIFNDEKKKKKKSYLNGDCYKTEDIPDDILQLKNLKTLLVIYFYLYILI